MDPTHLTLYHNLIVFCRIRNVYFRWVKLCSKFDVGSFEAKNMVFKFDYKKMNPFKSV